MIHCLQNTPGQSGTVAHLGWSLSRIRWDRPVSGPVVVSLGGQQSPNLASSSRRNTEPHARYPELWPLGLPAKLGAPAESVEVRRRQAIYVSVRDRRASVCPRCADTYQLMRAHPARAGMLLTRTLAMLHLRE